MYFKKQTITTTTTLLSWFLVFPLMAQLPSKAADADSLASEAETKVNKAIEATKEPAKTSPPETKNPAPATTTTTTTRSGGTTTTSRSSESLSPLLYNDGRMNYATSATKFQLTAADNLSNVDYIEYRIDDSPFMRYKEPFSIEQEGVRRIVYRAVDKAGNREADNSFVVTIDNTPPNVTAALNGPSYTKDNLNYVSTSTKVELYANDKYSGVKKIEYAINDEEFREGNSIVLTQPGRQRVRYRAVDNLNNVSVEQLSLSLEVDNTAPSVTIRPSRRLVEFEGKKYALRETIYIVEAIDEGAGVEKLLVRLDGEGDFQAYTNPIQFNTEGPHSIEAKAIDRVGNESEIVKLDIITDDDPPTSSLKIAE